jgi:hypothetical protein
MNDDKLWGECLIHDGTPAVSVHWCRPFDQFSSPGHLPTMWRFCQRCHELTIRRRWSLLVTHAVDEVRERLPEIEKPAYYEPAMSIVAFMAGRTGAWIHKDGSHGAVAPPDAPKRWADAETWRREGP